MKTRLLFIGMLLMSVSMFGQINFKITNSNPKIINTSVGTELTLLNELLDSIDKEIQTERSSVIDTTMVYSQNFKPSRLDTLKAFVERKIEDRQVVESLDINEFYENYYEDLITNLNAEKATLFQTTNTTSFEDIEETSKKAKELDEKIKLATTLKQSVVFKKTNLHYFFGPKDANTFFNIMYSENGKRFNYLNSSGINFGKNTGSVYTELASGNMDIIRLSFGAMIAKSDEGTTESNKADENTTSTSTEEAYQRLVSNGGNTVLKAEYPLLSYSSNNNQYNLISRLLFKASADFPAFGTQSEDFAGSLAAEFDLYLDASTSNNDIRLYGNFNASRINATEDFKTNLGIEKENFNFARITLGVVILEKFNFSVMFKTFSSEKSLENRNIIIGGSLLF